MNKVKYIFKRVFHVQWKNMYLIAKQISSKTRKPTFFILSDMFLCVFRYGAGYMDYFEFEFFLLNKDERKTFLTATINNKIIAKYNDRNYFETFSNKIKFNQVFKKYLNHDYINLEENSFSKFKNFCKNKKFIVGKVVDECGGKGIDVYSLNDYSLDELYKILLTKKQYLVEEKILQHDGMNRLYNGSINTLRIISFVTDDGEAVILNTVLRIGNGGSVDNFSSGGMYTFVSDEGKILIPAIDEMGSVYNEHPLTHTKLVGYEIPLFDEVIDFVKEISLVVPSMRYVGWDIAIGKDGPILIEGNEYSGVFQMKPSLSSTKVGLLPKYREFMDI